MSRFKQIRQRQKEFNVVKAWYDIEILLRAFDMMMESHIGHHNALHCLECQALQDTLEKMDKEYK